MIIIEIMRRAQGAQDEMMGLLDLIIELYWIKKNELEFKLESIIIKK